MAKQRVLELKAAETQKEKMELKELQSNEVQSFNKNYLINTYFYCR